MISEVSTMVLNQNYLLFINQYYIIMYNYIYLVLLSLYKFYTHRIYLTSFLNFLQKDLTRIFKIYDSGSHIWVHYWESRQAMVIKLCQIIHNRKMLKVKYQGYSLNTATLLKIQEGASSVVLPFCWISRVNPLINDRSINLILTIQRSLHLLQSMVSMTIFDKHYKIERETFFPQQIQIQLCINICKNFKCQVFCISDKKASTSLCLFW